MTPNITHTYLTRTLLPVCTILLFLLNSCREEIVIWPPEIISVGDSVHNDIRGFYLLNEGNMGSNKASLDYYDFRTATYTRDFYAFRNPSVPKELGDVGNDIAIYGSRLYVVVNCSNKIEVLNARNGQRIGQINIPNCRYLCFDGQYAYCTSYAGPVIPSAEHAQLGYVARIDTATLTIDKTCIVGYQPDGIAVMNGFLYVANSGGYMAPDYESTLSVIDLSSFTEVKRIHVAPNLHYVFADLYGNLWVSSRGDNNTLSSSVVCLDPNPQAGSDTILCSFNLPIGDICISGDSLYIIGKAFNMVTFEEETSYAIIDIHEKRLLTTCFITDGSEHQIRQPYGIAVHPLTHDIYLTDVKDYISPGMLHCYSSEGILRWSVRAGDIPAHIAFLHD